MKITQINGSSYEGKTEIALTLLATDLSVAEAISSVLALFAGQSLPGFKAEADMFTITDAKATDRGIGGTGNSLDMTPAAISAAVAALEAEANVIDEPAPAAKATRTRRPRTNPDAAPAALGNMKTVAEEFPEYAAATEAPPTERRRTRVTQEPAVDTVKTITDADLAKACSNAAAVVGIEVVQAVIKDFHVENMQQLAPDVREKFLGELEDEIRLAKEELAGAGK